MEITISNMLLRRVPHSSSSGSPETLLTGFMTVMFTLWAASSHGSGASHIGL